MKNIARAIGHTERQIWSIIQNLKEGGMLHLRKNGRSHQFTINFDAPLLHPTIEDLSLRSLMEGAVERVRPKMMTVSAIMAGLLPILWSTGTGSEVMQRIAAPMVGGMVTSTVLTLIVIPALYYLWRTGEAMVKRRSPTFERVYALSETVAPTAARSRTASVATSGCRRSGPTSSG